MNTLNEHQFGPWKMTPGMKKAFDHMQQNHIGVENAGTTNDIAAALGGNVSRTAHDRIWEHLHRLKDNGLIKIDYMQTPGARYSSAEEEHAWIPND